MQYARTALRIRATRQLTDTASSTDSSSSSGRPRTAVLCIVLSQDTVTPAHCTINHLTLRASPMAPHWSKPNRRHLNFFFDSLCRSREGEGCDLTPSTIRQATLSFAAAPTVGRPAPQASTVPLLQLQSDPF